MSAPVTDSLVSDYLARLTRAAAALAPQQRADLVAGISEHIDTARRSGEAPDEAAVRNLLDRLGDPAEIVAAADGGDQGAVPAPARGRGMGLEIAAVAMLTVGSFVMVIGWLFGVGLLWASRRFTLGEKVLATLVVPGGPFGVLLLFGAMLPSTQTCMATASSNDQTGQLVQGPETCTGFAFPSWLGIALFIAAVVGPFVVGAFLLVRANGRLDADVS
ncbi:MAG: hypothetical protein ABI468_05535 [Candidatus Nanopelagicales bacterium]